MSSLQSLSKALLEEAIRTGHIILENGDIRELKNNEILSCIRYVVSNGLTSSNSEDVQEYEEEHIPTNLPTEMFSKIEPPESNGTYKPYQSKLLNEHYPTEQIELFSAKEIMNTLRTYHSKME